MTPFTARQTAYRKAGMKKRTTIFDRLATSSPLDATAARVTSQGTHYEPKVAYAEHKHWDTPPPMKPLPNNPTIRNMVGRKFGRLTVVGLGDTKRGTGSSGASWVVRCACGDYEHRKTKAIENPLNSEDRCRKCHQLLINEKRLRSQGSRPIEDFTRS